MILRKSYWVSIHDKKVNKRNFLGKVTENSVSVMGKWKWDETAWKLSMWRIKWWSYRIFTLQGRFSQQGWKSSLWQQWSSSRGWRQWQRRAPFAASQSLVHNMQCLMTLFPVHQSSCIFRFSSQINKWREVNGSVIC